MKSRLLKNFIQEIQFKNRNPKETRVLALLDDISTNPERIFQQGEKLYRSRIILNEEEINKKTGFYGYDAEQSFIPPWRITRDLRANYRYIPYLYCSNHPYISLIEVRPRIGAKISIATILVNQNINLLDFTIQNKPTKMSETKYNLFVELSNLYSKPIANDDDTLDYIPTQFIAEYAKNLGYDGIAFTSSLAPEINNTNLERFNVVIFNYQKCSAIKSNVICLEANHSEFHQIDNDLDKLNTDCYVLEQLIAL